MQVIRVTIATTGVGRVFPGENNNGFFQFIGFFQLFLMDFSNYFSRGSKNGEILVYSLETETSLQKN